MSSSNSNQEPPTEPKGPVAYVTDFIYGKRLPGESKVQEDERRIKTFREFGTSFSVVNHVIKQSWHVAAIFGLCTGSLYTVYEAAKKKKIVSIEGI